MSNALGTINPVREIADLAHAAGALMMVDGAQSVPHMPVDFAALGCDFFAFTGHKMLGPTGVGILVAKPELLAGIEPFMGGGEMINDVTTEGSTWADGPRKFEAGTPPIAEVIGLGAAAEYLMGIGMERVRAHELGLTDYALEALKELEGIRVFGPADPVRRGCPISFELPDVHAHDVAQFLDQEGICVRAGHHCTKPLMGRVGRDRDRPGEHPRVQPARGDRCAGARPSPGPRLLRVAVARQGAKSGSGIAASPSMRNMPPIRSIQSNRSAPLRGRLTR